MISWGGKWVFGESFSFHDSRGNGNDQPRSETCWLHPQCSVTPSSTGWRCLGLKKIIRFLHIGFAVRAGGHNPNSGFASVSEHGMLIDLSGLHQLQLEPG